MSYHLPFFASVFIAVVGHCAEQAPPPRPKMVYYFPVTVGSKWVYICGSESGRKKDSESEEHVISVKDGKDGAKIVTLGFVDAKGKTYPARAFEVSDRGLFWTENLFGQPIHRPFCELKLPHKPGQTWGYDLSDDLNLTAQGPEKVKVPAGEFDCIRVEYRQDRNPIPAQIRWYAPGIGMVKIKSGDSVEVLKAFTPGKE